MKSIMVSRRALTDLEDCDTETGKMTQPPIPQPSAAAKYMAETSVPTLSPRSKEDDSDKSSTISRTSLSASSVSPLPSITGIPSFTSLASNNTVALHQANNSWRSSNSEMNKGFPSSPATPTYQLHQSMMTTTTTLTTTAPNNNFTVQDFSSRDSPLPVNLEGNGSFPPPTEPQSAMNNSLSPSFTLKVPKKPLNILLVDDAASILKMSSMMLKRGGHKITTAVNGADALHKIYHTLPGQLITPLNPNDPVEEEGGDEKSDINSRSNTPTKVDGIHKVLVKVASISGRAMSHNNLNQASRHKLTPHVSRQISQSRYLSTVTDVVDYNI
eukprot:gene8147-8811_t